MTVAAVRRWYVLIPLLIVSLSLAYLIGSRAQAEYEVDGAVVLLASASVQTVANPYAGSSASQLLALQATSSATRNAFSERGLSDDYDVGYDARSPVMQLIATADSEAVALATGEEIVDYLRTALANSQAELGIAEPDHVTLGVLVAPDQVNATEAGTLRATSVLGILGIALSVAVAVFVDAVLVRREGLAGDARAGALRSASESNAVIVRSEPMQSES